MSVRVGVFAICPRVAKLRRACPGGLRNALLHVKKHLAPAETSGLEDVLSQGGDIPSGGTPLLGLVGYYLYFWISRDNEI